MGSLWGCNALVSELPTGTVSLLFSDIEGSTALLRRLGVAYAAALDGQRQVLRKAWADHGGTELGTEGDSFYVVFPTAEGAVTAAAQGQRDLAGFEWPGGEQVRVRMGIHTGSPKVHDGGYVGMDVHRAARIAGIAHGGQVLVSSSTAALVTDCLPERVTVKDLGSHRLKDITNPEHVFQLAIEGLEQVFPPPKSLGTTSSLPRPATPLVGRDGELAELTGLLSSPGVRLVTLTGPGGSGKTRLAVGVAERLMDRFPDGIYFVSLAAVTTADVMWTSIAEVLDVPPEGRIPPGFFDHVAHRTALFVLDNLEQISGAGTVVAELLDHAGQVVVISTSRKPLAVTAEHVHPVPPLELPEDGGLEQAQGSGAVQLFVQHARKVKPSFALTADNAADVTQLCRHLDGLPLAIELAAARVRLLTPKALVARLDQALDIQGIAADQPRRQKTLRDTIAWSHDLLDPRQQVFFRHLGVFAGGADLDAIDAVSGDALGGGDALDLVADLADASLVTIGESANGEPRVGMLETIRAYALDQLNATGDKDTVSAGHADYFLRMAEETRGLLRSERYAEGQAWFEAELDNVREALAWALSPDQSPLSSEKTHLGLRLCAAVSGFWYHGGYYSEARRWLERAVDQAGETESVELALCLLRLGETLATLGDLDRAAEYGTASVTMLRRFNDIKGLSEALVSLATMETNRGEVDTARRLFQEALGAARSCGDWYVVSVLLSLSFLEGSQGNLEKSVALNQEALPIAHNLQDPAAMVVLRQNMACDLRLLGDLEKAHQQMQEVIPLALGLNEPANLPTIAEDYAAILAELGEHHFAVRLLGAADAMRERNATPRPSLQQDEIAGPIAKTRAALSPAEWQAAYQAGRDVTVEDALTKAHAATVTGAAD